MIVLFVRKTSFYPLDLPPEQCTPEGLAEHARCNVGTQRIEDIKGKILWQPKANDPLFRS